MLEAQDADLFDDLEAERVPSARGFGPRADIMETHLAEPALLTPRARVLEERAQHAATAKLGPHVHRRHVAVAVRNQQRRRRGLDGFRSSARIG